MAVDLFIAAASAAGAAGTVMAAFWKYEDVASPEAKQTIASWLKYRGSAPTYPRWADQLVTAFNWFFGERHFTLKCFMRSCLASLIAVSGLALVWGILRPQEFAYLFFISDSSKSGLAISLLLFVLAFNCIPDYVSYMKSRMILRVMSRSKRHFRLWEYAAIDTLLSAGIFFLLLAVSLSTMDIVFNGSTVGTALHSAISRIFDEKEVILMLELRSDWGSLPAGIFFYAALFVSAWTWLYALSASLTRFIVRSFPGLMTRTVWFFDVDGHPVRSFGCVAGMIVFISILALRELSRL
jgi:hypothetical protein